MGLRHGAVEVDLTAPVLRSKPVFMLFLVSIQFVIAAAVNMRFVLVFI